MYRSFRSFKPNTHTEIALYTTNFDFWNFDYDNQEKKSLYSLRFGMSIGRFCRCFQYTARSPTHVWSVCDIRDKNTWKWTRVQPISIFEMLIVTNRRRRASKFNTHSLEVLDIKNTAIVTKTQSTRSLTYVTFMCRFRDKHTRTWFPRLLNFWFLQLRSWRVRGKKSSWKGSRTSSCPAAIRTLVCIDWFPNSPLNLCNGLLGS